MRTRSSRFSLTEVGEAHFSLLHRKSGVAQLTRDTKSEPATLASLLPNGGLGANSDSRASCLKAWGVHVFFLKK